MLFWKQKENGNRWCWRQMERGKENLVPVSPRLLINHSVEMYLSKVTSLYLSKVSSMYLSEVTTAFWLLKLICRQFRQQITFFTGPVWSVCPTSILPTDDHQSSQNWKFPQNPATRRQNLNSAAWHCGQSERRQVRQWNFSAEEKVLKTGPVIGRLQTARFGWGFIKFVAWQWVSS